MIRGLNIVLAVTSLVALVGVYGLKYRVEETATRKAELESRIEHQQATLSVVKADWAYLNQPSQIEPIVERHADELKLAVADEKQFAKFEDLPMRPVSEPDSAALTDLIKSLDAGIDPAGGKIEGQ
ncbi:MAG TPA: hypothetical protein VIL84_02105 [Devosiaceae bacterium]